TCALPISTASSTRWSNHTAARAAVWFDQRVLDAVVDGVARAGFAFARALGAFDRHLVDGAVRGVSAGIEAGGRVVARWQNGRLRTYLLVVAAGVAGLVVLVYFLSS